MKSRSQSASASVGAAPAEQAGHADGGRVVVLEHVLAAVGVADRRLQLLREREHLVARVAGALAAVDGDLLGLADQLDRPVERGVGRPHHRAVGEDRVLEHRVVDLWARRRRRAG